MERQTFPTKTIVSLTLVVILTALGAIYAPQYCLRGFFAHWALLLLTIVICLSPIGHRFIGSAEQKKYNIFQWLAMIIGIQLPLLVLMVSLMIITATNQATLSMMHLFLIDWGLYPWALLGLIGALLGYISYTKGQPGTAHNIIKPIAPKLITDQSANITKGIVRMAHNLCVSLMIGFAIVTLLAILHQTLGLQLAVGFNTHMMIATVFIILLTSSKKWTKRLEMLTSHQAPPFVIALLYIALITFLLVAINIFLQMISNIFPPMEAAKSLTIFIENHTLPVWALLMASIPLTFIPSYGAIIANISKGYRIRSVLLANLLLPLILAAGLYQPLSHQQLWLPSPVLAGLFCLISILILLFIIFKQGYLGAMIHATLPGSTDIKPEDPHQYLQILLQLATIVVILYLAAGTYLIGILVLSSLIIPILLCLLALISYFRA